MEIRNLKTYIKVCEHMSFSKAASELGYAQSTITAQINQLENELGTALFDRHGKRFQLSDKGTSLLQYAHRIVALENEAISDLSDTTEPKGLLRIGVIESVGSVLLPSILKTYMELYPQVRIEVKTATTRMIMDMLRHDEIDLMLTLDERLFDPDWICTYAKGEPIVFLCNPNHPLSERESVSLAEVLKENIILTEKHCNYRHSLEHLCSEHGIAMKSSLEIGCTKTILDFTKENVGITFLPFFTASKLVKKGQLAIVPVKPNPLEMYLQLFHRKSKWYSPAMQAFDCILGKDK